jgi:hypothetical protein
MIQFYHEGAYQLLLLSPDITTATTLSYYYFSHTYTQCYKQGTSKKTDESRHESRRQTTNDFAASIPGRLHETKALLGNKTS